MYENKMSSPRIHLEMDADVIVEDEKALRAFARRVAIARAYEFDGGDLEEELETIASGPAGAITVALDLVSYIDSLPGVTADGSGVRARNPLDAPLPEGREPTI